MAALYERSTRSVPVDGLPGPLLDAVRAHAEERALSLEPVAGSFVTESRRLRKPGLLARMTGGADPDESHTVALVVGPRDVVVVTHGEQRGTAVLSARLEDVDVGPVAPLGIDVHDTGITITGFATSVDGTAGRGSFFVGLGPPGADEAERTLRDAVRAAKAG